MSTKCEACGVPWSDHLGIQGTCQQLLAARKRHKEYLKHIDRLIRERDEARGMVERLKQQLGDADKTVMENWSIDEKMQRLTAIVQRIMSAHWGMKMCECWVCREARAVGIGPIHEMLSHIGSNRTERPVPVNGWGMNE